MCVYTFEKVDNSFKIAFLSENHLRGLVPKAFVFLFEVFNDAGHDTASFASLTKKTALSFFPVLGTVKKHYLRCRQMCLLIQFSLPVLVVQKKCLKTSFYFLIETVNRFQPIKGKILSFYPIRCKAKPVCVSHSCHSRAFFPLKLLARLLFSIIE